MKWFRRFPVVGRLALLAVLFWGVNARLGAQDLNLANQYFANGEYEKAAATYGQLLEREGRSNDFVFNRYVDCLLNLEQYDECEKAIKKQIKKTPDNGLLYFTYGRLFERQSKFDDANEQWLKAIEKVAPDFNAINQLANRFVGASKYDLATRTYERGGQLLKDPTVFAMNLGELYRRTGDVPKMIESYLNGAVADPVRNLEQVKFYLARYLSGDDFTALQSQLYTRIQANEAPEYVELLAWSFVQRKDFKSALRQFRALDQRLSESGQRVMKLGDDAANAKDYDTAIAAYDYIIQEKGQLNPYFYRAKKESMSCRRRKITEGFTYTTEELRTLETDYEQFLNQYNINRETAPIVLELAELEALYINDLGKATSILGRLVEVRALEDEFRARAKINLADYYLMSGERWESTLLYSQVDKSLKEAQIGQEARFKNAKLAYYNGDFQWAQAQFDVLKASTSKLIANDALDLSVFIMDNLNLDTTADAITLYAGAELLVFQNRFDEALARLDTLRSNFPEHSLQDDIFYLQAQIAEKRRDYTGAALLYQKVAENYPEDIRADNALFALARLCETRLNDLERAKTLYEKIFNDYSGSVFAVDARKRFRFLRGDKVQ